MGSYILLDFVYYRFTKLLHLAKLGGKATMTVIYKTVISYMHTTKMCTCPVVGILIHYCC